jgi:hypothetical protein
VCHPGCRGARLARREECAYREYVSDEQRSPGGMHRRPGSCSYFLTGPKRFVTGQKSRFWAGSRRGTFAQGRRAFTYRDPRPVRKLAWSTHMGDAVRDGNAREPTTFSMWHLQAEAASVDCRRALALLGRCGASRHSGGPASQSYESATTVLGDRVRADLARSPEVSIVIHLARTGLLVLLERKVTDIRRIARNVRSARTRCSGDR